MRNYSVKRNGEIKLVLPFEIRANGTLWSKNGLPLLDSEAADFVAMGKEKILELAHAKRWADIPDGCFARVGLNPSGLLVEDLQAAREAAEAARTPAQKERSRISEMYYRADRLANSASENNVAGPMMIRAEAAAALAKWRKDYPDEAREEDARKIDAQADREEELAAGALLYDADGSISDEGFETIDRHDEHMAKASELRAKAAAMRA